MTDDEHRSIEHLYTDALREVVDEDGYGAWRSIDAPDAVSLSFGFPFPESFPNDDLVTAAKAVFKQEGDRALQYGGGDYPDRLETAVADRERRLGTDCSAENVLLTNGATHAIDLVCSTFLEGGDEVFVEAPTFMGALRVFANYGVTVTGFENDAIGLNVDAVEAELRRRRADGRDGPKLLYTVPDFQNPTGTTMSLDRRERLVDLAAEFDFAVLEDGAYSELRFEGEHVAPLSALDENGRVVRVGTFSKTIAPGVRTGWVLGSEPVVGAVGRMRAGGTNTFTQGVLGRYCAEGKLAANVEELRVAYEARRDHLLDCLETHMPTEATWTDPDGGFFVWVTMPAGVDTEAMLPTAAEEGVTYLPGEMFFPDDRGARSLRLSFSHADFEAMERGVEALARASQAAIAARTPEQAQEESSSRSAR